MIRKLLFLTILLIYVSKNAQDLKSTNNIFVKIVLKSTTTIYVNSNNSTGPWEGSKEFPFQAIKDGITAANLNEIVLVENASYNIQEHITIPKGVTLIMEPGVSNKFENGIGISIQGKLKALGNVTDSIIFSGSQPGEFWGGIKFINSDEGSELRYCKIENVEGPTELKGGAIYCINSSPMITNCLFEDNNADYGGAVFCEYNSSPEIYNCTFVNNTSSIAGGSIYSENSHPIICQNYFMNNSCNGVLGGAAITIMDSLHSYNNMVTSKQYPQESRITKSNTNERNDEFIFTSKNKNYALKTPNELVPLGGILSNNLDNNHPKINNKLAVQSRFSNLIRKIPIIEGNTFYNNSSGNLGGAISIFQNKAVITNNRFELNESNQGGAIYLANCDSVNISWNIFQKNVANGNGGTIFTETGKNNSIERNLFVKNTAVNGAGIYLDSSNSLISNNTFFANIAENNGSSLFSIKGNNKATNNIFWDNDTTNPGHISGSGLEVTYCNIKNSYSGIGNINMNPRFIDTTSSNYRISFDSPCINTGDPQSPKDPDSSRADMGAFYYHRIFSKIEVLPHSMNFTQKQLAQEKTITIKNIGSNELHWNLKSLAKWIQIPQNVGVTKVSDSTELRLVLNAVTLTPGETYQTSVNIISNDEDVQSIAIPVTLTVEDHFEIVSENPIVTSNHISRGSCWGDFDNDDDLDLFIINGYPENENNSYFENLGNGSFNAILEGNLVDDNMSSLGCSAGDYDNDGDLDIFVANASNQKNMLFSNNGNATFDKIIEGKIVNESSNSNSCSWSDYNNDGYLDIYIANGIPTGNNYLYRSNKDGSFSKVTSGEIVTDSINSQSCSWSDYDNDGDPDLFVANWDNYNGLYKNNGDGTFEKQVDGDVVNDENNSISGSWGDFDNDGDMDLFVTNWNSEDRLYTNNGDGSFVKRAKTPMEYDIQYSYGSNWIDYDNDGDLDLYVLAVSKPNRLFSNNGDGTFLEVKKSNLVQIESQNSTSSSWADYDKDGDQDILITSYLMGENNYLLRNTGNTNNWVNIECIGGANALNGLSNVSAIGTKVRLKAVIKGDSIWQMREISSQPGYQGQSSLNVEFGLGDANLIDSIIVEWPSKLVQILENVEVNQFIEIHEKDAPTSIYEYNNIPTDFVLYSCYPNPFNPSTNIKYGIPKRSKVFISIYNILGQKIKTLVDKELKPGYYNAQWHGKNDYGSKVASGFYIYRIVAGDYIDTKKMILLK